MACSTTPMGRWGGLLGASTRLSQLWRSRLGPCLPRKASFLVGDMGHESLCIRSGDRSLWWPVGGFLGQRRLGGSAGALGGAGKGAAGLVGGVRPPSPASGGAYRLTSTSILWPGLWKTPFSPSGSSPDLVPGRLAPRFPALGVSALLAGGKSASAVCGGEGVAGCELAPGEPRYLGTASCPGFRSWGHSVSPGWNGSW